MKESAHRARWWTPLPDGRIQCDLCPRDCRLKDGQAGHCFVRRREGDEMVLSTYGFSSGFAVDPIEKKPLNHFFPGSQVLSFGTAGCNLACRFCQNWDLSKSRDQHRSSVSGDPEYVADLAKAQGCQSVAFTYNDPMIFAEYAMDVAKVCHAVNIKTVAVTAGYIHPSPRKEFFAQMDAANIDLKGFSEEFYVKYTGAHLAPILDTLKYVHHETDTWLEITTLLIPGKNDSNEEIKNECEWILNQLGPDVPLHFTAFHPDFKMRDLERTPLATVQRARTLAKDIGLNYVYTGNVVDPKGDRTLCPECQEVLIQRDWHALKLNHLDHASHCPKCEHPIPGFF